MASLILRIVIISVLFAAVGHTVLADGGNSEVAFAYGFSVSDLPSTNPHALFGFKGSTSILPQVSLGGYIFESGYADGTGGNAFDYSLTGIDLSYHVASNGGDTYFGIRA